MWDEQPTDRSPQLEHLPPDRSPLHLNRRLRSLFGHSQSEVLVCRLFSTQQHKHHFHESAFQVNINKLSRTWYSLGSSSSLQADDSSFIVTKNLLTKSSTASGSSAAAAITQRNAIVVDVTYLQSLPVVRDILRLPAWQGRLGLLPLPHAYEYF